jgi:hypothetical protein
LEQTEDALILRIVPGEAPMAPESIGAALAAAFAAAGALSPPIRVELVDAVVKTPLGKTPLIKALSRGIPHEPAEARQS